MIPADLSPSLQNLAAALVDQEAARVLVEPQGRSEGFWFGGGNVVEDAEGIFWLCGRYRNHGDSRTGVGAGERGLELAIFRATSPLGPWQKALSFSKADLAHSGEGVVSIEGVSLLLGDNGVELYVSTEKARAYPEAIRSFQKPGTGYWDIDLLSAPTVAELTPDSPQRIVSSTAAATLHIKDPVAFAHPNNKGTALIYCSHPHSWSSSNTGLAIRESDQSEFEIATDAMLHRGPIWDVAATRVTDRLLVPAQGVLADRPPVSLYFYDGAECLRSLDENSKAVKRPRGYSCEEIGGLAVGLDASFPAIERLSVDAPSFVSPHGTGCSRYVSTLVTEQGILATWQQSQPDLSQPLVGNFLPKEAVAEILGG